MKLVISEIAQSTVLAGSDFGRELLGRLIVLAGHDGGAPKVVFLDFLGVEVATASFLRESVIALHKTIRSRRSSLYPVITNPSRVVQDDLRVLTEAMGEVLLVCWLSKDGSVERQKILGQLDPKQQLTFNLVAARGEVDAAELMRDHEDNVGQTAWNNRLAAIANLGLIFEVSQGRAKRYKAIFFGVSDGN